MKLALILATMLTSPVFAANHYFSDCATGGAGTQANPYCLDPGNDGVRESFDYLMDGTGPEVAAGDTIFLCAGSCDGSGSGTYHLQPHLSTWQNTYTLFDPEFGTTTLGAIVVDIKAYSGENVTISGDANSDNAYTAGVDAQRFWDTHKKNSASAYTGYRFTGFTIEKFAERTFNIGDVSGGAFILDGMTIQYGGAGTVGNAYFAPLTGDGGMAAMGCTNTRAQLDLINNAIDNYATFIFGHNRNGASLTVQNSTIRQNCQYVVRSNGNCYGSGGTTSNADIEACNPAYSAGNITMDHNSIYSVFGLHNGHQGRGWTWTNNQVYDFFGGIATEENVISTTITDNNISCRGTYKTDSYGKCRTAIIINDGDTGEQNCNDDGSGGLPHCGTRNVMIARNKIWGNNYYTNAGFLLGGISYTAHNASSQNSGAASATIENNFIWYTQSSSGCSSAEGNFTESPLSIGTSDAITVQNNTLYNNGCSTYLRTGFSAYSGGTAAVAHTFINNIVNFEHYYTGGSDQLG